MAEEYYISRKLELLKDIDKMMKKMKQILVSYYGEEFTDIVTRETRHLYETLILKLPYIGGKKNPLTGALIWSAQALALYRAIKNHGKSADEIGKLLYNFNLESINAYPRFLRRLHRRLRYHRFMRARKKWAVESQKSKYPGDWVLTIIEGDGKAFDWGIDYTECGICKFYHAQGADEFTPYLCLLDFPISKTLDSGLVRTMTLAEGAEKCDFRFKQGREVKQGWPPELLKRKEPWKPKRKKK